MAKEVGKLSALAVAKVVDPGYYGDGGGLLLQVTKSGAKTWVFRFKSPVTGKPREMGLGALSTYSLAEARIRARDARQAVDAGRDPIAEREETRQKARLEAAKAMTFDQCAAAYIEAHRAGWKNEKHGAQWESTLAKYASPVIGLLPVASVDMSLVLRVLEPIWSTKTETASRLRGRIESVLDWATVRGFRSGDNPARWKGHLDKVLPTPGKVQKVKHHAALSYHDAGAFMADLRQREGIGARALEFAILTAARSGEVRGAQWQEIDTLKRVWTIPADRMKLAREHVVPLSDDAVKLLNAVPKFEGKSLVFPSGKGNELSDMTLAAVIKRMHEAETKAGRKGYTDQKQLDKDGNPKIVTPHGFRSTFRDWAGETTSFPREVIEHALAHQLKDKAEAAYQRGDLLAKRARLMQAWAEYLAVSAGGAVVTPINRVVA